MGARSASLAAGATVTASAKRLAAKFKPKQKWEGTEATTRALGSSGMILNLRVFFFFLVSEWKQQEAIPTALLSDYK